jgi:hypothetical protein
MRGVAPTAPGKPVKFVVVDAYTSSRSSTWRVWTGKRQDDVFLVRGRIGLRMEALTSQRLGTVAVSFVAGHASGHVSTHLCRSDTDTSVGGTEWLKYTIAKGWG